MSPTLTWLAKLPFAVPIEAAKWTAAITTGAVWKTAEAGQKVLRAADEVATRTIARGISGQIRFWP